MTAWLVRRLTTWLVRRLSRRKVGRWVEQKAERTADQVDIPTGLTHMSRGDRLLGWLVDHSADLIRRSTASGRSTCQKAGRIEGCSIASPDRKLSGRLNIRVTGRLVARLVR